MSILSGERCTHIEWQQQVFEDPERERGNGTEEVERSEEALRQTQFYAQMEERRREWKCVG